MKILHAIQSVDPVGGGPVEGIKQLALATCALHEHRVVSIDSPSAPFLREFPLPITPLGPGSVLGYSRKLTAWMRTHATDFDCVMIHGLWRFISFGSWLALRRRRTTPYVVVVHGMLDPWFKRKFPLKHLKKWLFWPWTEYRVLKDAAAVIYSCEQERLRARESFWLYRAKEAVAPNIVTGPTGNAAIQRKLFLETYPDTAGKRNFLFLGRLHPIKGCELLLKAFSETTQLVPNLHLIMAGPASTGYARSLKNQAARLGIDNLITWTGMLGEDMKWGAFHTAEAFVLPSHVESFGISVAEALACGVPVLISDQVKIWPGIARDHAGMVESDTLDGTRRLLRRWIAVSEIERMQMRRRARSCFSSQFAPAGSAEQLFRVLREVCHVSPRRPGTEAVFPPGHATAAADRPPPRLVATSFLKR